MLRAGAGARAGVGSAGLAAARLSSAGAKPATALAIVWIEGPMAELCGATCAVSATGVPRGSIAAISGAASANGDAEDAWSMVSGDGRSPRSVAAETVGAAGEELAGGDFAGTALVTARSGLPAAGMYDGAAGGASAAVRVRPSSAVVAGAVFRVFGAKAAVDAGVAPTPAAVRSVAPADGDGEIVDVAAGEPGVAAFVIAAGPGAGAR